MKAKQETPLWIFWLIGMGIIAISVLAGLLNGNAWQLFADIALNIGISIIAVSMIDWIWRRVGGDPLMNAISELRTATILLSDLHNAGVKRIFRSRSRADESKRCITEKMVRAKKVDMLGFVLRSGWSSTPDFREILKNQVGEEKTQFRIVIFDPIKSRMADQRSFEEDGKPSKRIANIAKSTLEALEDIKHKLASKDQGALKIRVVRDTGIYCSIIRVDEAMLVTKYLLHLSGSNSETMEIEGTDTEFFKLYMEEFNAVWDRATDWPCQ